MTSRELVEVSFRCNSEVGDDFPGEEDVVFGDGGADVVDDQWVAGGGEGVDGDADVVFAVV